MAATEPKSMLDKEIQIPEWEQAGAATKGNAPERSRVPMRAGLGAKFDSVLPPHKRYLRMRRKVFLLVLLGGLLALLALIIGLAVGLTSKLKSQTLPLPSNTETFAGDFTYYQPGLGACGITSTSSDNIVSISHFVFDKAGSSSSTGGNSNNNPLCGLMVRAERFDERVGERRSVDLKVVDRCTGCQPEDLDTSLGAFEQLAPQASGRVDVTWAWLQPAPTG